VAKKKASARPADTEPADESPERARWLIERARHISKRPFLDVTGLGVAPFLCAADRFLEAHADYQELVAGPGRDSDSAAPLLSAAWASAQQLQKALEDAGLFSHPIRGTCRPPGPDHKVSGLAALGSGVRRLLGTLEQSTFAVTSLVMGEPQVTLCVPAGQVFDFDAAAVAEIAFGAKHLRRYLDEKQTPPGNSRVLFDAQTRTITLDDKPHHVDTFRAFLIYQILYQFIPEPISRSKLAGKDMRMRGDKTARQAIEELPRALKNTVKSGPRGYWVELPPLENKSTV
jgi:hypothetical protein